MDCNYRVLGVGFGPSNLALAALFEEQIATAPFDLLFLEQKPSFEWHGGMLLDGATVQMSFLKDLATIRNPQSRFTFLNYLMHRDRLHEFVNLRCMYPTRVEFNDYYGWVAEQLQNRVRYNLRVESILPARKANGVVTHLRVISKGVDNDRHEFETDGLVLAPGGKPNLPDGVEVSRDSRVFHSSEFLPRVREHFPDRDEPYRFVVVGSGQTAAETMRSLYLSYPHATVTAMLRHFAYKPADESHFVNEIFMPNQIDWFYGLPDDQRHAVFNAHRDTNYSAVDRDLLKTIYGELYEAKVRGESRVGIIPFVELETARDDGDEVTLSYRHLIEQRTTSMTADAVVLATGFSRPQVPSLLSELTPYLQFDERGNLRVDRAYRLRTSEEFEPAVYLQGLCERTHGISDTLVSNLPIRAADIYDSVVQHLIARDSRLRTTHGHCSTNVGSI